MKQQRQLERIVEKQKEELKLIAAQREGRGDASAGQNKEVVKLRKQAAMLQKQVRDAKKAADEAKAESEKVAKLAQKLGQLQPFVSVFPQECMGQLAYFGPT